MQIHTKNPSETQKAGEVFAKELHGGDVLVLYGNLGAGKTTFVQGLAKGLGVTKRIISPTFTIIRRYVIASVAKQSDKKIATSQAPRNDIKTLYHIDLYRVVSEDDIKGLGLEEILKEKNAVVAIEWPEKLGSFLPKKRWEIRFSDTTEQDEREVIIN